MIGCCSPRNRKLNNTTGQADPELSLHRGQKNVHHTLVPARLAECQDVELIRREVGEGVTGGVWHGAGLPACAVSKPGRWSTYPIEVGSDLIIRAVSARFW